MKKLLVLAVLLISSLSIGQTKRVPIFSEKIGTVELTYQKAIYLDNSSPTKYYAFIAFQNEEYKTIVDSKIIGFFSQETLTEFITDLKSVQEQMLTKEKVTIDWTKSNYKLQLYEFNVGNLYINTIQRGKGHTIINLKNVTKLIEKLSLIEIGKEELKQI